MLKKESGPIMPQSEAVTTTLGEDTEFKGTLKFGKSLKIAGKFEGDMQSSGNLIIARSGEIKAEVKVGSIVVEGKVNGNIHASDIVELKSTAEVYGDITAGKIKIDEGVVFVGKADIRPKDKQGQPVPGSPTSAISSSAIGGVKKDHSKGDNKGENK